MWNPWKGADYQSRGLLLLGESCYFDYGNPMPNPNHPIELVEDAIASPVKPRAFMTALTRALCGSLNPSTDDASAAWSTVAFTNYVPRAVAGGSRRRPDSKAWKEAQDEWPQLLAMLSPKNVIVIGVQNWRSLPLAAKQTDDVKTFEHANGIATCRWTWHPAAGGSWRSIRKSVDVAEGQDV